MKTRFRILAAALALAVSAIALPTVSAAQGTPAEATRKGVIKKVDATTIVLTPSDAKKTEATYTLSAGAKHSGSCDVGDEVVLTYHYEQGKPIVTAVAGKSSK